MNAIPPIQPTAAAAAAAPCSPGAPTVGAMPPAGGTVPPAGRAKNAEPKDFGAALSAAEKDDGHQAARHAASTAADPALLGMQLPVTGNPPPLVPAAAPMPASAQPSPQSSAQLSAQASPAIQGAVAPAAGPGPGLAPQNAGLVPGAAADVDPPARDRPQALESSRRLVAAAPPSTVRSPAAAEAELATPASTATQASAAPPSSAPVPALQMPAAVNPTPASFAAAAAANDGVQPKSPSPTDRAAPADSGSLALASARLPASAASMASTAPTASTARTARTAAIAPNSTAADDKPAHGANGGSPSAMPTDGAAGAAAAFAAPGVAPSARHDGASAATLPLHAGINTPEFSRELADRVTWMVDHGLNGASLQVNPPHLGPIELRVSVERGHAAVWMSAQNATTLDALQSNAPKLREMLGNQGFGQVSVDISQRSFQDRSAHPQKDGWAAASGGERDRAAVPAGSVRGARQVQGALDAYA